MMAIELELTLYFDEGDPVPTVAELEDAFNCTVVEYVDEEV